jgi:hypothetical protein
MRSRWFCYPLVPSHFTGCCIDGDEFFEAMLRELSSATGKGNRVYTLLGPNRPWRSWLKSHRASGLIQRGLAVGAHLLGLLGIGHLAGFAVTLGARRLPRLQAWNLGTLRPSSISELLALYNKYNYRHVKIVGYNNGVVHFGHKYPDRTIVSTVRCNHIARTQGNTATFDGGVTLRRAIGLVSAAGKEFCVLPNYSYISVGTAFFVPIHGSASDCPTLGETIDKVLLFDPAKDRLISARRDTPAFRHYMYNLENDVLLLRLRFRVQPKSLYFVKRTQLDNPSSQELVSLFQDKTASNVELRKSRASSTLVNVSKYYKAPPAGSDALAFPTDSLGRLWDKLEANPISRTLFHGLTRRFAYHVEMFLTVDEFAVFWETHQQLPVAKMQVRYIKQDSLPHSPFREHDCISVDMFMLRKHKRAFDAYVKETFRAVQFNRGKHSM